MNSAAKEAKFEGGYKVINFKVSPEDYRAYRIKAAEYGIPISDVCRLALSDEAIWKRAAKLKEQSKKKEGNQ